MSDGGNFHCHVSHLECSGTGERYPAGRLHNVSATGKPLLVRYDLSAIGNKISKSDLAGRGTDLWRYRELLPLRSATDVVSLGEVMTPLLRLGKTSRRLDGVDLLVKDEGRLPTGSFKARGIAVAVSMAKSLGVRKIAVATVGSAGVALAAYCARADIQANIFCPKDTPDQTLREMAVYGACVIDTDGALEDCNALVAEKCAENDWFNISTLKEPYRIEGKKTMGLELAEQLGWDLPDVIFYPTGGGTGFIGVWKAFDELQELGWIGEERPRMVAVQTKGCCPIVRAFEQGRTEIETPWPEIRTNVHGVRVAKPLGDFLILRVIFDSGGFGSAVSDEDAERTRFDVARADGTLLSPEGAACIAAYRKALRNGKVSRNERAVVFNTAIGLRTQISEK